MNPREDRRVVLLAGVLLLFSACSAALAQSAATSAAPDGGKIVELYLAKSDGNGAEGDRAENFDLADIPIYCIVKLNAPGGTAVRMVLLAATVPGIKANSKIVTTNYVLKDREDQVTFYGQPNDKWLAGRYKVEVYLDNKLEKNPRLQYRRRRCRDQSRCYKTPNDSRKASCGDQIQTGKATMIAPFSREP